MNTKLPWPPSVNHYYRHVGSRVLISKEGRAYRERIRAIAVVRHWPCFADRIEVLIDAYPPDKRKRDLDNLLKPLLDALQHARLYVNDCLIDRLSIRRGKPAKPGYVHVAVYGMKGVTDGKM